MHNEVFTIDTSGRVQFSFIVAVGSRLEAARNVPGGWDEHGTAWHGLLATARPRYPLATTAHRAFTGKMTSLASAGALQVIYGGSVAGALAAA